MLINLLQWLDKDLPNIWGEGAIFAFSGFDGETDSSSGFVATYARDRYSLLLHTPRRRLLTITPPEYGSVKVATGDVYAVETASGPLCVTYERWHTIIGMIPEGTELSLRFEDGENAVDKGEYLLSPDAQRRDYLVLLKDDNRFALSYGISAEQAHARAQAGLEKDIPEVIQERLEIYDRAPRLATGSADNRLLRKCISVMKVNTLSPEGTIQQLWSTPSRVPHREMWLWDSVFHSLTMNFVSPPMAFDFIKSVLKTQREDGMIAHRSGPDGRASIITQPPILAGGVWENYLVQKDRSCLEYALPRLERYLDWNCQNRDKNHNGLLEWFIERDPSCRSGESGMDNSPRFDEAILLDAVDFSTFQALDMKYVANICQELGLSERAREWRARSEAISKKIHTHLWDEESGFYYDADLDGNLFTCQAVTGFLPLLLDDIPSDHVEELVRKLKDPSLFNTAFPIPSIAISDPSWSTDMWQGATWVNTNYLVTIGLLKQGKRAEARWLTDKTIAHVRKYYEQFGVTFEFYDAKDEIPPVYCDRKGKHQEPYDIRNKIDSVRDYHWTAALTAVYFLKQNNVQ